MSKSGKTCWPASGGVGGLYHEHDFRLGDDGAEWSNTGNVTGVNTWFGAAMFLWLKSTEFQQDGIGSFSFITHDNYDGGNFSIRAYFFDTDDGSLPDTKQFGFGARLYDDGDAIDQTINVNTVNKIIAANNTFYEVNTTITPVGRLTAGHHQAILKMVRHNDATSGNPIFHSLKVRYGLA